MSLKNLLKDSDVFRHLAHKGRKALKPPTKLSHKQNERQTAGLRKKPTSPRHHERRDSILMTCHYQDLGISADWFKQISLAARPIRSTVHISEWWHIISMEFLRSFFRRPDHISRTVIFKGGNYNSKNGVEILGTG